MTRKTLRETLDKTCPQKADLKPSQFGGPACEICAAIKQLGEIVDRTKHAIDESETIKAYQEMLKEYKKINSAHKTCVGCGLCFGGNHLAFPAYTSTDGKQFCQYCAAGIKKRGYNVFMKLAKHDDDESKEKKPAVNLTGKFNKGEKTIG